VADWRTEPPERVRKPSEHRGLLPDLSSDVRSALRLFTQAPAFAAGAILTLSLGIGASTAIFSLADATLLRPLSVPDADRIVLNSSFWSYPDFRDLERHQTSLEDVAAWGWLGPAAVEHGGTTNAVLGILASGAYSRLLGLRPVAGRLLDERDDVAGAPVTALITEGLWGRIFGNDPATIGATVSINQRQATIVGVLPASFRGTSLRGRPELVVSLGAAPQVAIGFLERPDVYQARTSLWLQVAGRLKPEGNRERAEDEVNAIYRQAHSSATPTDRQVLVPLLTRAVGLDRSTDLRTFILILGGATLITMLVACVTAANLFLIRADRRERELALRVVLGAGRWRIARLMMAESVLFSFAGALGGLVVARLSLALLSVYTLPGEIVVRDLRLEVNAGVMVFTVLLGLLTSALFSVVPLRRVQGMDVTSALRGSQGHSARQPLRNSLVAIQVALCVMLLGGGLAFGRAVQRAFHLDLGFDTERPAIVGLRTSSLRHTRDQSLGLQDRVLDAAAAEPWVRAAGFAVGRLLNDPLSTALEVPGYVPARPEDLEVGVNVVSSGYLEAVGIPLRQGRTIRRTDTASSPEVAVVSESLARQFWPARNALGARFSRRGSPEVMTVVGIVGDIRRGLERDPDLMIYRPSPQYVGAFDLTDPYLFVSARDLDASGAARETVALLRRVDPLVPVASTQTMREHVAVAAMTPRLGFTLFTLFSGVAAVLTGIGVYAVVAFAVARRTREIGIRVALGAQTSSIVGLVVRQGTLPIGAGLLFGTVGYWWTSGALRTFLLSVPAFDSALAASTAAAIAVVGVVALVVPLRRALSVDPVATLRSE
jgi:predicted permease